jgi:integrase
MLAENVYKLNENTVFDDIQSYFNNLDMYKRDGEKHSKTRVSYEMSIRQFFKETRDKDIEHLTVEDLKFKKNEVQDYRNHLKAKFEYSNSTINQKITAIKCLFEELKSVEYDVNPSIFKLRRLKEQVQSYGHLSQTEAERFAEAVFHTETHKKEIKHLLILFAIRSSFRIDEILNLEWDDFEYFNGVYKVKTTGKGTKENCTSISAKLYDRIAKLKDTNKPDNPKIFQVSKDSINDMMNRLRDFLNIDPKRRITFHSFRKVAIDWTFETEGVEAAIKHSNHSNYDTLVNHYIDKKRDFTQTPGVKMDEEINWSFMDQMNLDEFKEFFKQSNQYKLYVELKKFNESR